MSKSQAIPQASWTALQAVWGLLQAHVKIWHMLVAIAIYTTLKETAWRGLHFHQWVLWGFNSAVNWLDMFINNVPILKHLF